MSQSIAITTPMGRTEALSVPAQTVRSDRWRALAERLGLQLVGTLHRLVYRATGGSLGRTVQGGPVLLLTTIGRRSGRPRTWPLCYVPEGDALILVASAGGAARHPGWYLNLRERRRVTVQVGSQARIMRARTVEGAERARLWARVVDYYPSCVDYQRRTTRLIPVVVLESTTPPRFDSPARGGFSVRMTSETEA